MKKLSFYSFCLLIGLFSCKKILDKLLTFSFTDEAKISIPANSVVDIPVTIATPEIYSSANEEFEKNGSSLDYVKNVRLSEMTLNILTPDTQTFNFLKSIEISISSEGLSDVLIAQKTNIPNNDSKTLALETTSADFAEHIKKGKYSLKISLTSDEALEGKVDLKSIMTFKVTATAIKE